jgi:hypothetical protein
MSGRERIVKQEKIELNIEFGKYWQAFVDTLPEVAKSPSRLLGVGLSLSNIAVE